MSDSSFGLLAKRRFGWLFVSQFAGAANDNLFKNAMGILIIFRIGSAGGLSPQILVSLAAGVFILPFFLFSAMAGLVADRWEKSRLIRIVKFAEMPITLFAAAALIAANAWLLMAALFLLGVQAAFFGPLKYAVLPELLAPPELVAGNALVEGGTFLAILLGTMAGGLLILTPMGPLVVSVAMVGLAGVGFAASLGIPQGRPGNAGLALEGGVFGETLAVLRDLKADRRLFLAVMGVSWFWFIGATFLALFPAFAKDVLFADEQVVTLMLTMFSLGIGIGSMACARLLQGRLTTRYVPWAAFGMSLFSVDLALAASPVGGAGLLAGISAFATTATGLRVLADLALIAVCGGIYIVPLYTTLQAKSDPGARARVVAANNIANAGFMVASALASALLLALGLGVGQIFMAVAGATILAGLALWRLPD